MYFISSLSAPRCGGLRVDRLLVAVLGLLRRPRRRLRRPRRRHRLRHRRCLLPRREEESQRVRRAATGWALGYVKSFSSRILRTTL